MSKHKSKKEWIELSKNNDAKLVINTIKKLNRRKFILHSDHGTQYSSRQVQKILKSKDSKPSMGRIGNSLDNRESEYFFSCLKGELLNHTNLSTSKFKQINNIVTEYIGWYNNERIQKRLHWKSPIKFSNMQANL